MKINHSIEYSTIQMYLYQLYTRVYFPENIFWEGFKKFKMEYPVTMIEFNVTFLSKGKLIY